ncbi:unnamed protein product [Coffea canephora]|uniref:Uncharacterized protein n=1 Tax=Coffea canephora TaxID=49390 RepID=A0A068VCI6_COFCA|nr:unnamed protein product [Coffea canephora]
MCQIRIAIRALPMNVSRTYQDPRLCLGESISRASFLALLSASLFFASDSALAFKGGGPYGAEVTREQDLFGKDFNGTSLIKQDFKISILRQAKFKSATLVGASFFDANLTGISSTKMSFADLVWKNRIFCLK